MCRLQSARKEVFKPCGGERAGEVLNDWRRRVVKGVVKVVVKLETCGFGG